MIYQTIITNQKESKSLNNLISNLKDDGVIWIISNDEHNKNEIKSLTFELIEDLTNKGLILKNVILWINNFEKINPLITNNYKSILFFVKSDKYFFDKDPVREKHIWKDIEWGKRERNYNPKGKDPSNVWIFTEDDGEGKITRFKPLSLNEIIERCILCSTKKNDKVLLKIKGVNKINDLKRKVEYGN